VVALREDALDVRKSVRRRLLFANIAGGAATLGFVQLASGSALAPEFPDPVRLLAPLVPFAILLAGAYTWANNASLRTLAWALEGRAPTEAEKFELLRQPWRQALRPLAFWVAGAVLYAILAAAAGADSTTVFRVVEGTLLGGLTTCALAYLLIERSYQPLFAHVLEGLPSQRPRTLGIRMRLLLTWAVGSGVPLLAISLDSLVGGGDIPRGALAFLAIVGLGAGMIATAASASSLAVPLDGIRRALARVGTGDLDVGLMVDDGSEVGEVQAGVNRMVTGLRERQTLRDLFQRHVGDEVARRALERGTGLGGEQADATAVFVDIIGSTAMTEVLPPDEVVAVLNDFFGAVVRTVAAQGGWVNKFEGDGALCIFGVPGTQPDHAARGLRAARLLARALEVLREIHPGLEAGIGVSSGRVVAGNVGTEARYEYTVIGRAVNEAARLTDVAKGRAIKVLASTDAVRRGGSEAAQWHDVGTIALRGHTAPTAVFEPAAVAPAPSTGPR
jgi:adenylate cyclase